MSPYIPEGKLLEIKDAAPIAEVIGQYINLTPRGRYLVGLCPFHSESNPSFTVYPERQIFHCYGCGAGGNVFTFLMQHLNLSFPETVTELAKRYGIPLGERDIGTNAARETKKKQSYYEVNELAAAFFQGNLAHPGIGATARAYLARRGLDPQVVSEYRLGFAPDDWRGLEKHFSRRNAPLNAALELGLIISKTSGGYYDRFRGRLIFPIHDREGRIVAFGGRIIGEGEPKYLNSPESPIYSKGRNLYGLYQAREYLRKERLAILVEGYMDLLALRGQGIQPVAASLGTALTRDQVRLLKGYCSRVVLVFDGDEAGLRAMMRSLPHFASEHLPVRVLTLPSGEDPDSYAGKYGVEIFKSPWDHSQPLFEFILDKIFSSTEPGVEGKISALDQLRPYFAALTDPAERALWLQPAAKRLGISETALANALKNTRSSPPTPLQVTPQRVIAIEKKLLKLILCHPEALEDIPLANWAEDFEDARLREIAELIIACHEEHGCLDYGMLLVKVQDPELRNQICAFSLSQGEYTREDLEHLQRALKKHRLNKELRLLKQRIKEHPPHSSRQECLAYTARLTDIEQQLRDM